MSNFIDLDTGKIIYATMKDEHEIVNISEKNVKVGNIGKVVAGEINSQEIEFNIPRYYDNVDLLDKNFYILYETKGGIFKVDAVDISYNDEYIRFNWLLDENATMYPGKITAVIQIQGLDEHGKIYVKKTMNFSIPIEEALSEFDADGIYRSWATDIESRIVALEEYASSSSTIFIGTNNEYNAAVQNGEIKSGMIVTITDR